MSSGSGYEKSTASYTANFKPAPRVAGVRGYGIPRAPGEIDLPLDGNEGGAPSAAVVALSATLGPDALRRYPSAARLAGLLAARWGVDADRVLVTAGGDDALDRLMRAVLCEGREIVFPVPSFEMIERYARLASGTIVEVPWPEGRYPREAVLAAINERTAVVCVVTPNNPTGAAASFEDVRAVAEAAPHAVVLLDQAYAELADEDLTAPALALPNVVVVRSMSKAYGLAGLRVGYALGPAELLGWMRAAAGPYTVAGPSIQIATERLLQPPDEMLAYVARARLERQALFELLRELGCSPVPSQANFVFARVPDPIALRDAMARRGIGIRAFPGKRHLEDAVRITVPGSERDFERLCAALREQAREVAP